MLEYIALYIRSNSFGPTYREIQTSLGYKSVSTVATHIDNLIARGWLAKRTRSARSLEVLYQWRETSDSMRTIDEVIERLVAEETATAQDDIAVLERAKAIIKKYG